MATETLPFDAAQYLKDPDDQRELLIVAFATGDATYIKSALGTVARARGTGAVAKQSGVSRDALYEALSPSGDPRLSTAMRSQLPLDFLPQAFFNRPRSGGITQ